MREFKDARAVCMRALCRRVSIEFVVADGRWWNPAFESPINGKKQIIIVGFDPARTKRRPAWRH